MKGRALRFLAVLFIVLLLPHFSFAKGREVVKPVSADNIDSRIKEFKSKLAREISRPEQDVCAIERINEELDRRKEEAFAALTVMRAAQLVPSLNLKPREFAFFVDAYTEMPAYIQEEDLGLASGAEMLVIYRDPIPLRINLYSKGLQEARKKMYSSGFHYSHPEHSPELYRLAAMLVHERAHQQWVAHKGRIPRRGRETDECELYALEAQRKQLALFFGAGKIPHRLYYFWLEGIDSQISSIQKRLKEEHAVVVASASPNDD